MDCPVNKETLDEFYDSYIVLSLSNHQLKAPFLKSVQRCKEIISAYKAAFPCDCAQLDLLLWLRTHNLISIKDCLVAMSEVVKYMYDHFDEMLGMEFRRGLEIYTISFAMKWTMIISFSL